MLLALLTAAAAFAQTPDQDHDAGVAAFEAGEYRLAVGLFLDARDHGLDTPALNYNLGSAWYRLGDYVQAREAFLRAAEAPELAPLAWYNLGLAATQLGDIDDARAWFVRVLDGRDHAALRVLAATMLDRLGHGTGDHDDPADLGAYPVPTTAWQGFMIGGLGHDDNVLLVSDDDLLGGSDRGDFFLDVFAQAWREIGRDAAGTRTLEFDAGAWLLRHIRLDDFDMASARTGLTYEHATTTWVTGGGAHGAWALLDGRGLTREALFSARAARRLPSGLLRLRYELGLIGAMRGDYSYLEGNRQRLDARVTRIEAGVRMHLQYQLEHNDRTDLVTPRFTSASPLRNQFGVTVEMPLREALELRAEIQYMRSRYRDANELATGARVTRVDDRLGLGGRLAWRAPGGGELSVEYRYTDNDSTIPVYEYSRHRIMAGMLLMF